VHGQQSLPESLSGDQKARSYEAPAFFLPLFTQVPGSREFSEVRTAAVQHLCVRLSSLRCNYYIADP
jgi:hypothetical protein